METGFRFRCYFRCYADKTQAQTLLRWIGCQRFIDNAKAGLARGILASALGKTREYASDKAQRAGKLTIEVPPHRSSQECSACGHTHRDNRPTQAGFVCQCCGHTENADFNASKVIRARGVNLIVSGEYREKVSKRTMRMANKQSHTVGADRSNRDESQEPVETSVRHPAGHGQMLGSQKQESMAARPAETPATSLRL